MATEKTKNTLPCLVHVLLYALPFLFLTLEPAALAIIVGTHFAIDRWRLARYVVWFKNQIGPARTRAPWSECRETGFHSSVPPWLAVWLLIIVDNTLHLVINGAILHYLG